MPLQSGYGMISMRGRLGGLGRVRRLHGLLGRLGLPLCLRWLGRSSVTVR